MKYSKRIKDLRNDHEPKLSQKALAEILGITYNQVQNYEYGKSEMPAKHLIKMAYLFNTSADYILGITNETKPYPRA